MTPERWSLVEEIFAAAKDIPIADLDGFLRDRCNNDSQLEREVFSLLQYHHSASGSLLLDTPPWRPLFIDTPLPPIFESGVTFGHYLILNLVGSGGMGDVYLAEDTRLRRQVALKLLPPWFNQEEIQVARFTMEALAASALNHPNVPVVYEAGEIDQRHYIASEFVDGSSVADRISHGVVPWREAIEIALHVAHALQAAHAAGIVHRDVKPSNILIANSGKVKLVDFGIAKLVEGLDLRTQGDDSLTMTGMVIGTPGYMAPEQAAGVSVDARSDLWSLAAVLYEMVAGRKPTPGDPRIPGSANLPSHLARVLERALQPDPANRYSNVEEFAVGLNHARHAFPLGRHFLLVSSIAAVVVILVAGYEILTHRKPLAEPGFKIGESIKLTNSGNVVDAIISPDSRYVIYSVERSGQESLRLHQVDTGADIERIPFVNGQYIGLAFSPDGNYFYYTLDPHGDVRYLYQAPVLGGPARKVIDDIDSPPSFSPDGSRLAFIRGNTAKGVIELHITDIDGSHDRITATRPLSQRFSTYGVVWSQDGKTIYTGAYDDHLKAFLVGIDVASGDQRNLSQPLWGFVGRVSLLSDGQTLIFPVTIPGSESAELVQFSIANGKWSAITSDLAGYEQAQSAGGDIVTVQQSRLSSIWLAPAHSSSTAQRITPPAGHFDEVVWSSDGTMVSGIQAGRQENLWRIARDGVVEQLTRGQFVDLHPSVLPTLGTIAFTSNRAGGWTIWTIDANGNSLLELTRGEGMLWYSSSFAPDGSILLDAISDGQSHILRRSRRGESPTQLLRVQARAPEVSRDGKSMACQIMDQSSTMQWIVVVVDLATLRVIKRFSNIPVNQTVKWLPDGSALTYLRDENGVSNIWKTSISTGDEAPLTHFKEDKIFSFDWSSNSRELAMVRGIAASDVLLTRRAK